MKKILSVTVGIPAFNEEANIAHLIRDIIRQKGKRFRLARILIHSDGSTDHTVQVAHKVKSSLVRVVVHAKRMGKAKRLNEIMRMTKSDVLVLLDGDVMVKDEKFLEKLLTPMKKNGVDLATANIMELPQVSGIGKLLRMSMEFKRSIFARFRHGHNVYTCHGRGRALSRRFYRTLVFKDSNNEDAYSYFACITGGYRYAFVPSAMVWYRLPETLSDHERQSIRFYGSQSGLLSDFGKDRVLYEYGLPKGLVLRAAIDHIAIHPEFCLYIMLAGFLKLKSMIVPHQKNHWDIATSSKILRMVKLFSFT